MTYLDLVNAVLIRLRENQIDGRPSDPSNFLRDPYYRSIGEHVNDAKQQVEDSWQWSHLRQEDTLTMVADQVVYSLPDSADNSYVLKRIQMDDEGNFLQAVAPRKMRQWLAGPTQPNSAKPGYYCNEPTDPVTGLQQISVFPPPKEAWTATVESYHRQARLKLPDTRLLVPSLPVYTLATALASRERGELGGQPTSELFGMAQDALSDAIAIDSARWADEMDWFSDQVNWHQTNVGTA